MQQRRFDFAGEQSVSLLCREPPEAQAGRTLTWQFDGECRLDAEAAAKQPAAAADDGELPASTAPPAAADPDLIGHDIWPASIALCRYLAAHPHLVVDQHVVELGAGMGLVGLLCAQLGAAAVLLTDYEPVVVEQMRQNAALNGQHQRCTAQQLDWRRPLDSLRPEQRGAWRLVVAADVLYASVVVQPFIDTLALLLHEEGIAFIGHQVRRAVVLDRTTRLPRLEDADEPLESFKASCGAAGLKVRLLSSRQTCSNVDTDPMVLLAVGRRQGRGLGDLPVPWLEGN